MPDTDRLREHPKDRLAEPVQRVDLAAAAATLRAEQHDAVSGHRQVALVKRGQVTVILFVFAVDGALKEHKTDGEVTIHVVAGRIAVTVGTHVEELRPGELLSIAPNEPHALHALEASEMLLTICRSVTTA
jgi:quercetin dioxygenase-like cupin family protein